MTTTATTRRETVEALRTIRERWAELLLAIETDPHAGWPPPQLAHLMRAGDDELLVEDRAPLVLREHPAPLNLGALDTGLAVEHGIFDRCDFLAGYQQGRGDDPRLWRTMSEHGPGSRVHGLHWACVWLEGRVLDEDTTPEEQLDGTYAPAPFLPLPGFLLVELHTVTRAWARRILRTLGVQDTPVPDHPCPWCAGELTLHTAPGEAPSITCATGPACTAPVDLDRQGRRVWEWGDLLDLIGALGAGELLGRVGPAAA